MKNVYDIRHEKNLLYILSPNGDSDEKETVSENIYAKTAVIFYLYYLHTLSVYLPYVDGVSKDIDIYIISSRKEVLEAVRTHLNQSGRKRVQYILKENRGRDVSALLVEGAEIIKPYKYICFLHDKQARNAKVKQDTDLWIENLWGNLMGGSDYVANVLRMFEENRRLGILAPPEPVGDNFCTWYGYGWHKSYSVTRELADMLQLNTDLSPDKPPITIGTALWFRRQSLQKLFDFGWRYGDFDDGKLRYQDYLSYGIERIFAYVAQDAGFDTGTVMTVDYARKQTNYLQYSTSILFSEAKRFFPVPCISDLKAYKINKEKLLRFAGKNRNLYLYGAGEMGRFCFFLLREANLFPQGFLVSGMDGGSMVCGLAVTSIQDKKECLDCAVIVTAFEERIRNEMVKNLKDRGFYNYLVFWGD